MDGRQLIGSRPGTRSWAVVTAWAVTLAGLLLWPTTRSGYLLGHDLVFTARQPLGLASIGLSSTSPRAVPLDALVAMAERIADGAVVGRLALLLPVLAAGLGVATLLGSQHLAARLAACGFAVWNPYVIERLALGQWALLWAYAALPWLVLAVARGRGAAGWALRAVALAAAAITPTGGVIAAVTAVSVATRRPRRELAGVALLAAAMQLPWLVPAMVSTASATSDPAAVAAFAARAEHPGGVLLSLLGGGGIWDAEVVPASRGGVLAWLALAVLVGALFGVGRLRELIGARLVAALLWLAAGGLLVALASSLPGGQALVRAAVDHVPGAGLLRDAQKWIMPLVLVEALLVGAAIDRIADRLQAARWRAVLAVAALAAPLILLPDAAATLRPTVEPVHYPRDWAVVIDLAGSGEATVVPFGAYREFAWAPGRSVLDPAPRLLHVPTVVDDRLSVSGRLLRGEDPRAAAVAGALASGADLAARLAAEGIRWVVVEHGTPGDVPDLAGLEVSHAGYDVSLYRVPGPVRSVGVSAARVAAVVAGDVLALVALVGLVGWATWARWVAWVCGRRRRTRKASRADGF